MNPFALSGILAGVSSLSFGLLVLLKTTNKRLGHIWFLFSVSVALWGFAVLWAGISKDASVALAIWRLACALSVPWIAIFFYHFVCRFCEIKRPLWVFVHYMIGLFCLLASPTPLLYAGVRWAFNSFYYPLPGELYALFTLWWFGSVIYSHCELVRAYKKVPPARKNQIKYFFLATAIGFGGGGLDYLPTFGIELYPWGNFAIFLYPLIMSYAILRFRLMDIRIVLRRAGLIALIYIALAALLLPLGWILYPALVSNKWGFPLAVIASSAVLSVGPFIYAYLVGKSAFFQEKVVSGVTHEFKSPLAAIQSATAILKEQVGGLPEAMRARQADYLLMIQNNTQRLEKFIRDLLEVAKIEQGGAELKLQETDLNEVCEKALELYRPLAEEKGLKLEFVPNGVDPVRCDPDKMELVLSNLLSNAIKFTEEGSVKVQVDSLDHEVTVSIQDTGVAIPPEELPHIFEKFYQGRNGKDTKGTGLGLSIVKGWIEAHGGKVWVESDGIGTGARLTLTLPKHV